MIRCIDGPSDLPGACESIGLLERGMLVAYSSHHPVPCRRLAGDRLLVLSIAIIVTTLVSGCPHDDHPLGLTPR